jgi:hypothetical protein
MTIIDSQVHAYEANTPKRPWHNVPNWPDHVTGDEMVAAMDKVGVDGAIFISAFGLYRYDGSYAVEVQQTHPGRFAIVKPVDPDDPAVAEVIADWKKTPGTVGIRIMLPKESGRQPNDPGLDRILRGPPATIFRSTSSSGATWTWAPRSSIAIPTRGSSSTIWASYSLTCRPRRRSPGLTFRRCWNSPSVRTQ